MKVHQLKFSQIPQAEFGLVGIPCDIFVVRVNKSIIKNVMKK